MNRFHALCGSAFALFAASPAFAAIVQADLDALETSITADVGLIATWAFAVLGVVLSLVIGLKLVKKMANRAT